MSLRVKCRNCGKSLKISMVHAGKKAKCSGCGQSLQIPSEQELQQLLAKQTPAPAPTEPDPFASSDDRLVASLSSNLPAPSFDDDDFDFPEPAPTSEPSDNPFASPMSASDYSPRSEASSGRADYAGFWTRFGAFFLDQLIVTCLNVGIGITLGILFAMGAAGSGDSTDALELVANLIGLVVLWLYYALQESSAHQATIGKRAAGIKVTDLNGRPISFGKASGRFFGKILSFLTLYIGFIMAGFTKKKQALHDMLAGTLVVKS